MVFSFYAGCWMLDAGCWIQDTGCKIQDTELKSVINLENLSYCSFYHNQPANIGLW
ncbi:MAG: hypothetical protein M0Q38_15170 [Bacteroidales bacterium]|nr:hypothetical protein [Bacteroidales bacterium]